MGSANAGIQTELKSVSPLLASRHMSRGTERAGGGVSFSGAGSGQDQVRLCSSGNQRAESR